jgi:integrase
MIPLTVLSNENESRVTRDRLELLTALISAPGFDPHYRADVIAIPRDHPIYGWGCAVADCERPRRNHSAQLCERHHQAWRIAEASGVTLSAFVQDAEPLAAMFGAGLELCRICGDRAVFHRPTRLCKRHHRSWYRTVTTDPDTDFSRWLQGQRPYPSYGSCRCVVCADPAASPLGLCHQHANRYYQVGKPGGARLPEGWALRLESKGLPVAVHYDDEAVFRRWCAEANPVYRAGVINLVGLPGVLKAEFKWGLHAHCQDRDPTAWEVFEVQRLVNVCRRHGYASLADHDGDRWKDLDGKAVLDARVSQIGREIIDWLRVVYYSPADTKNAGFIETDHFGRRFPVARSKFDLTTVPQRWLRDLLWDHLAELLRSERAPRTRGPFDSFRRGCVELGAYLQANAPQGGEAPALLTAAHAQGFVADQRHRERHGLPSLGVTRPDGTPSVVTTVTRRIVFNAIRRLLYRALESGRAAEIGLTRDFIIEFPAAGPDPKGSRNPFSDDVAQALADEANLQAFAATYDPHDRGLRDVWEVIVVTGRRCSEVLKLRLDCIGRYGELPMLWHDQTKVGNYNEGIRIPEPLFARIEQRRAKTIARFERRHGRLPTPQERAVMALFPSNVRNRAEIRSISYGFFNHSFKCWVDGLALPSTVAHQARHTLATNLLRAGASLAHIRRYLGQVSDRMAEHYVKVAHSDLEDILQCVWVAGPAAANPGELLAGQSPLTREQAMALAVDLSRRSTPAEGGFCTFQPVVNGAACPWNLDCHNCDKFVMSGADLLYWRRKQQQWRSIAERAPDEATANYLHDVFEPTARAIAGLERALAGLDLLDEALSLDLRRPQDYFHRVWSVNFPAANLAAVGEANDPDDQEIA